MAAIVLRTHCCQTRQATSTHHISLYLAVDIPEWLQRLPAGHEQPSSTARVSCQQSSDVLIACQCSGSPLTNDVTSYTPPL